MRPLGLILLALVVLVVFSPNLVSVADEIKSLPTRRPLPQASSNEFSSLQCASCHQMKAGFSHPVNVPLQAGMSARLPLVHGKLVCTTCHDSNVDAHRIARATRDPLLRIGNAEVLCSQCHDSSDNTRASSHALAIGQAHLLGDSSKAKPGGLIRETQNCLTCHDGLISQDVAMTSLRGSFDSMGEHPVNVTYRSHTDTTDQILVKPATSLNPVIRLFDGKVGCGSCHSPYSRQESLLVMSNYRSQLCLGCHNQ